MQRERRTIDITIGNYRSAVPHNFRILRGWSQEIAADWYGVSERTWRRWEDVGAPAHALKRIAVWSRKTKEGQEYAHLLNRPATGA